MDKIGKLKQLLKSLKSVIVAYSGGVDSTFLLKMAVDTLGKDNVLAVIAKSETYPKREYESAVRLARQMRAPFKVISTKEIDIKGYRKNPVNRCYYCKRELMQRLKSMAKKMKFENVIDGTNYDDRLDTRYGSKALRELGVKSPLHEAKITKADIRKFSKKLRLSTHSKPSFACLASRIPSGSIITKKRLERVDRSEEFLQNLGFRQVRVRDYEDIARIEVEKAEIRKFLRLNLSEITRCFNKLGWRHVTLDLAGYRTGSMNL